MSKPPSLPSEPSREGQGKSRLDSWKEIAGYLKRDIRTVQRWEGKEGLPVYRHLHSDRGSVYAYKEEIDTWCRSRCAPLERDGQEERTTSGNGKGPVDEPRTDPMGPSAEELPIRPRSSRIAAFTLPALVAAGAVALWWVGSFTGPRALSPARSKSLAPTRLLASAVRDGGRIPFIPVGSRPRRAVLTPDGSELYVSNSGENTVSVISTATNAITRLVKVGNRPDAIVASPDGRSVYVGNHGGGVSVIDTKSKTVRTLDVGAPVNDIVLTGDGRKIYAAMSFSGLKCVLTGTGEVKKIPTVVCPQFLALDPEGMRLYVNYQCGGPGGESGHDSIDIYDVRTDTIVETINRLASVGGTLAISPNGAQLWENGLDACRNPGYDHRGCPIVPGDIINVVRTGDRRLLKALGFPEAQSFWNGGVDLVSFFPDGSRAIIGGAVLTRIIDTASFATVETTRLPSSGCVSFMPDGSRAYAPLPLRNVVAVIDLATGHCEPPASDIAALWSADGAAEDVRGPNHGTLSGGAGFGPGRVGQAFLLDGENSFVVVRNHQLHFPSDSFAVSAWVKLNERGREGTVGARGSSSREMAVVECGSASGLGGWMLARTADDRFVFSLGQNTASVTTRTRAEPGEWYHVLVNKTSDRLSIYVNGVCEAVLRGGPFLSSFEGDVFIGSRAGVSSFLSGLVDEVAVYQRALGDSEIRDVFNAAAAAGPA